MLIENPSRKGTPATSRISGVRRYCGRGSCIGFIFLLSGILTAVLLAASPDANRLRHTHLKVACSTALFRGVDRGELIATAKLWLQTLGKREGLLIDEPEVDLADDVRQLRTQVDSGSFDLVVSSSLEYLALDRKSVLAPQITLTASSSGTGKIKYLLIVKSDGRFKSLADLKGKALHTYSRSASNLNRIWLEVQLNAAHLPPANELFSSVSAATKPSTACLPIFFGQADACLLDGPSWDTLRELNPQVATSLTVLAESQPLLESLVSLRSNRQEYRSEIVHSLGSLQDDPEGRQVLLLFKCSRAVEIKMADLEQVAELRSAYLNIGRPAEKKLLIPFAALGTVILRAP